MDILGADERPFLARIFDVFCRNSIHMQQSLNQRVQNKPLKLLNQVSGNNNYFLLMERPRHSLLWCSNYLYDQVVKRMAIASLRHSSNITPPQRDVWFLEYAPKSTTDSDKVIYLSLTGLFPDNLFIDFWYARIPLI